MELIIGRGLQCLSGCKVKRRSFLPRVCGVCSAGGCLSRTARLSHGKVAERPAAALTLGRRGHRRGAQPFKPAHTNAHTHVHVDSPSHLCVCVLAGLCVCVQVLECHLCFSNCLAAHWAEFMTSLFNRCNSIFLSYQTHKHLRCLFGTRTSIFPRGPHGFGRVDVFSSFHHSATVGCV